MTDKSKPRTGQSKPKVEKLELNRETVQDLTESEAEAAEGGRVVGSKGVCPHTLGCRSKICSPHPCATEGRHCTHNCVTNLCAAGA